MPACEPARMNIGVIEVPMDSPTVANVAANLERIDGPAGRSPRFTWRCQTDGGDATERRAHGAP